MRWMVNQRLPFQSGYRPVLGNCGHGFVGGVLAKPMEDSACLRVVHPHFGLASCHHPAIKI
jgi:hypothetical protein